MPQYASSCDVQESLLGPSHYKTDALPKELRSQPEGAQNTLKPKMYNSVRCVLFQKCDLRKK